MKAQSWILLALGALRTVHSSSNPPPRFAFVRRQHIGNSLFPGLNIREDGCPSNQVKCSTSWGGCCRTGEVCCSFGCCGSGTTCSEEKRKCIRDGKEEGTASQCPAGNYKCDGQWTPSEGPCCEVGRTCDTTGCYKDKVAQPGKAEEVFFFKPAPRPTLPETSSNPPDPSTSTQPTLKPVVIVVPQGPSPTPTPTPSAKPQEEPFNPDEGDNGGGGDNNGNDSNNDNDNTENPNGENNDDRGGTNDNQDASSSSTSTSTSTSSTSKTPGSTPKTTTKVTSRVTTSVKTTRTDSAGNTFETTVVKETDYVFDAEVPLGGDDKSNEGGNGGKKSKKNLTAIVVGSLSGLILLLIIAIIFTLRRRRKQNAQYVRANSKLSRYTSTSSSSSKYSSLTKKQQAGLIFEVSEINHAQMELDGRSMREMYSSPAEMEHPPVEMEHPPVEMWAQHRPYPRSHHSARRSRREEESTYRSQRRSQTTVGANSIALLTPSSTTPLKRDSDYNFF